MTFFTVSYLKYLRIHAKKHILCIFYATILGIHVKKVIVSQSNVNQFQIWVYIAVWGRKFMATGIINFNSQDFSKFPIMLWSVW